MFNFIFLEKFTIILHTLKNILMLNLFSKFTIKNNKNITTDLLHKTKIYMILLYKFQVFHLTKFKWNFFFS